MIHKLIFILAFGAFTQTHAQTPSQIQMMAKLPPSISARFLDLSELPACPGNMIIDLGDFKKLQGMYSSGPSDYEKGLNNEIIVDTQGIRYISYAFTLESHSSLSSDRTTRKTRTIEDLESQGFCVKNSFQNQNIDGVSTALVTVTLVNKDPIAKKIVISAKYELSSNKYLMRWTSTDLEDASLMSAASRVNGGKFFTEVFHKDFK